jgi:oligosaccharide translocation protein RFT1
MIVTSLGFLGCAMVFARVEGMKEIGLVYANVMNLGARAVYGWAFAREYFARNSVENDISNMALRADWRRCVPPREVLVASVIAALVVRLSEARSALSNALDASSADAKVRILHIGIGSVVFVTWAALW